MRELADRGRLARPVDADDEHDGRLPVEGEALLAVHGDHLGDHLLEPFEQVCLTGRVPSLELLDDLDGRRNAAVGRDEGLLDPLPRLLVARVKDELAGQRLTARRKRFAQAPEPAAALLLVGGGGNVVVAQELRPGARHALSACASGSAGRRFDTTCETPSPPIVTP